MRISTDDVLTAKHSRYINFHIVPKASLNLSVFSTGMY